jgi:hypothetical protein
MFHVTLSAGQIAIIFLMGVVFGVVVTCTTRGEGDV